MAKNSARRRPRPNHFSQIPATTIQRSRFDRSFDYKTTLDAGYLIPVLVDEVLPGDTFSLRMNSFVRMNTLVAPFMDNVYMDSFFFFVPNRLVWDNWQRFCGEQKNPGDSTDFLIPILRNPGTFPVGSIFDYMGLPTGIAINNTYNPINSLPLRAYNLIYNNWFRDENLIDSVPVPTGDGPDDMSNFKLLKRAKRHDYFTSALPWPQKGPAVEVGLSGNAPISGNAFFESAEEGGSFSFIDPNGLVGVSHIPIATSGNRNYYFDSLTMNGTKPYGGPNNTNLYYIDSDIVSTDQSGGDTKRVDNTLDGFMSSDSAEVSLGNLKLSSDSSLYADLSGVNAISINDLRQAFQIQKFYEKWARGGSRYTETLRVMFNVISPDARLQRPEYLGGTHSRINIVPTPQTSSTDSTSPQSNLSAFGVLGDSAHGFTKSFVEHGYVIGLVCIRADVTYQQGLNRMWSRRSLFDFYWPTLAHLGEQPILNKEIYTQGTAQDDEVFGYQERYAEYRYKPSFITGKLRSTDPQSLDVWHLAQKFDNLPTLSQDFIEENPPINRVIAVQNEPQFFADFYFNFSCSRPMPVYSVPGLVDHF
ncbi:MAG: major capsid protein [Microviridae sp.]|nr:MAG: major capsid protein [Microviridae sp.]